MRKLQLIALVTTLGLSLVITPSAQAKAKINKPSAPTIVSLTSSAPKKGKVNVTVTIALPASNGGSKITGSKVTAGGKSCTIKKLRTSCTIKGIKNGKSLKVIAKSKNKKGFGSKSAAVPFVVGSGNWTASAVATPTSPTATPTTTPTALNCATGGTCEVGDRGPGGGIVFYIHASGSFSSGAACGINCKYLEVAPATWQSGAVEVDRIYQWSTDNSTPTGQDLVTPSNEGWIGFEKSNFKIGQGFYNTSVMKVSGATSDAQAAALSYVGTSVAGQWFIPSVNELTELCKYARGQLTGDPSVGCYSTSGPLKGGTENDLGGFAPGNVCSYLTSSEVLEDSGGISIFVLNFDGSDGGSVNKTDQMCIRPIRAF